MGKNVQHVQHVKSNVVENGSPKLPTPSVLAEGEIAINFAEGYETLSIKSSSGNIKTFSSDEYYTEQKLGSGFTGANSGRTVTDVIVEKVNVADVVSAITSANSASTNPVSVKVVAENELVMSNALNDLNDRKLDASAYTPTDLSNYYTKSETSGATEISNALGGKLDVSEYATFSAETNTSINDLSGQSETIAVALNDLDERKLDASAYTPSENVVWVSDTGENSVVQKGSSGVASGDYAVSEGYQTSGTNLASHAEGLYTITNNKAEHASGYYNVSNSASIEFGDSGNTLFSVGNGDSSTRHNAFEIRQNGDIYIVSGNTDILLQDHIGGSDITVDQVIDSGTSASTNAVATKAVYEVITNIEDIVGSGYTSSSITDVIESRDQTIAAALNYLNSKGVVSAVTVSSNLNNVVCPNQILGNEMSGAQAAVVYVNSGTTTDYTITVSTTYKTPDGNQLNLTCPKNGYCEISYLNINGTIYVRGI